MPTELILAAAHPLVHVNASLNATAAVLLVIGITMIKRGRVVAHKRVMLSAFGVSVAFLTSYLYYHSLHLHVPFTDPGAIRYVYYAVLLTHIPLAFAVPPLAICQIYLGYRAMGCCGPPGSPDNQMGNAAYAARHRRLARWTYPIWLYVSVTGVVVYVMLYHLWPSAAL
jgi:putative membrane protein